LAIHLAARPAAGRIAGPAATAAPALAPQQDVDERIEHKVEGDADVGHSEEDALLVLRIGQTHRNGHLVDLHIGMNNNLNKKKKKRCGPLSFFIEYVFICF